MSDSSSNDPSVDNKVNEAASLQSTSGSAPTSSFESFNKVNFPSRVAAVPYPPSTSFNTVPRPYRPRSNSLRDSAFLKKKALETIAESFQNSTDDSQVTAPAQNAPAPESSEPLASRTFQPYGSIPPESAANGITIWSRVRKLTGRQWKVLLLLSLCHFIVHGTLVAPYSFFSKEASKKGSTSAHCGLLYGIPYFVILCMAPLFQKSFHCCPCKSFGAVGAVMLAVSTALTGPVIYLPEGAPFFYSALVARVGVAISVSVYFVTTTPAILDYFPQQFGIASSVVGFAASIGQVAGSGFGGLLYDNVGFMFTFIINGILILPAAIFSYCMTRKEDLITIPIQEDKDTSKMPKSPFFQLGFFIDSVILFTTTSTLGFYQVNFEPHIRSFQFSSKVIGALYVALGLVYILAFPVWGLICKYMGKVRLLSIIPCSFTAVGLLLAGPAAFIPLMGEIWLVPVCQTILGLGLSGKRSCSYYEALDIIPKGDAVVEKQMHTRLYRIFNFLIYLGSGFGPTIGGYFVTSFGYQTATMIFFGFESTLILLIITTELCPAKNFQSPSPSP